MDVFYWWTPIYRKPVQFTMVFYLKLILIMSEWDLYVVLSEHWFFITRDSLYIDMSIFTAEAMNQLVRNLFKIENQSFIVS